MSDLAARHEAHRQSALDDEDREYAQLPGDPSSMEIIGCDEYIRLSTPNEIDAAYEFGRLTWGSDLFPSYM